MPSLDDLTKLAESNSKLLLAISEVCVFLESFLAICVQTATLIAAVLEKIEKGGGCLTTEMMAGRAQTTMEMVQACTDFDITLWLDIEHHSALSKCKTLAERMQLTKTLLLQRQNPKGQPLTPPKQC
jgi:hypothetical protein